MSDADENEQKTKVVPKGKKPVADKTIVQVAAPASVWPEAPTGSEEEVPAGIAPDAAEPPEDAPEPDHVVRAFIEEEALGDTIFSHAIESPTLSEGNADAETGPDAEVEPDVEAAPADADEPVEMETVEAEEVQPALADPLAEQEQEPLAEARIEVPVQQQFASLLSALSDRVQKHPGGHDLLAVLRMLEGQTGHGCSQS